MTYVSVLAAALALVIGSAVTFIVVALVTAALLPRGHPIADRLRALAGQVPKVALLAIGHAENLIFIALMVAFAALTIWFAWHA